MTQNSKLSPEEEEAWFLDNYGVCALRKCQCLDPKVPWKGRLCFNWKPLGAKNAEELRKIVMKTVN